MQRLASDEQRYGTLWDDRNGERSNGVNINAFLLVNPLPLAQMQMQASCDTAHGLRKA